MNARGAVTSVAAPARLLKAAAIAGPVRPRLSSRPPQGPSPELLAHEPGGGGPGRGGWPFSYGEGGLRGGESRDHPAVGPTPDQAVEWPRIEAWVREWRPQARFALPTVLLGTSLSSTGRGSWRNHRDLSPEGALALVPMPHAIVLTEPSKPLSGPVRTQHGTRDTATFHLLPFPTRRRKEANKCDSRDHSGESRSWGGGWSERWCSDAPRSQPL